MKFCGYDLSGKKKFFLIAGPCVLESEGLAMKVAGELKDAALKLNIFLIFKSSYDKANRSSITSYRGPGIDEGLKILAKVKDSFGLPVSTDVHSVEDVAAVKDVVDLIQIPAFLCRQTDLLVSAANSGRTVNVKKGQFIAPEDAVNIVEKLRDSGCGSYSVTERGYTFGYNNLVVDMRSFGIIRSAKIPVIFDATHSTQLPGGGLQSGGQRDFAPLLARSAVAAGIDGLFMEVHPEPERALCDASNQFYLDKVEPLLQVLSEIDDVVKNAGL